MLREFAPDAEMVVPLEGRVRLQHWQREAELGATFRALASPDPAAHLLDQVAAYEQADARTAGHGASARRPVEELEQTVRLLATEAGAVIKDADDDVVRVFFGDHVDAFLESLAVAHGVGQQVAHDLFDVRRGRRGPPAGGPRRAASRASRASAPSGIDHGREQVLEKDRLVREVDDVALDAGHDQQVLDESNKSLRLGANVGDDLRRGRVVKVARKKLAAAIDRRDRRSQLVRQDAHERVARCTRGAHVGDVAHDHDRRPDAV